MAPVVQQDHLPLLWEDGRGPERDKEDGFLIAGNAVFVTRDKGSRWTEVRRFTPNEFDGAFQPLHQVVIPNLGLTIGELWDLDALAVVCAEQGRYEFLLSAAPLPITGAVGSPINPVAIL